MNWFDRFIEWFIGASISSTEIPPEVVMQPIQTPPSVDTLAPDWSTQQNAYHNVRVLCDLANLNVTEKNLICACVYQESRFKNSALNNNKNAQGQIVSTDYGICQVNDYYHIGQGKDFPSVQYVLDNPDKVVQWMISMYQHGLLKQWVSYSSGAYQQWLSQHSPMWLLSTSAPDIGI